MHGHIHPCHQPSTSVGKNCKSQLCQMILLWSVSCHELKFDTQLPFAPFAPLLQQFVFTGCIQKTQIHKYTTQIHALLHLFYNNLFSLGVFRKHKYTNTQTQIHKFVCLCICVVFGFRNHDTNSSQLLIMPLMSQLNKFKCLT